VDAVAYQGGCHRRRAVRLLQHGFQGVRLVPRRNSDSILRANPVSWCGSCELHVDAEIGFLQQVDYFLQSIAVLTGNPHQIPLNEPDLLLAVFDERTISRAFSIGMPCCREISWRTVDPAARVTAPKVNPFSGTLRLTSFCSRCR